MTRALQCGRREAAAAILDFWLPPSAARMALLPATGFARALAECGLVIPPRPPALPARHPQVDPGAQLIH